MGVLAGGGRSFAAATAVSFTSYGSDHWLQALGMRTELVRPTKVVTLVGVGRNRLDDLAPPRFTQPARQRAFI
jgi:hypothetical protein